MSKDFGARRVRRGPVQQTVFLAAALAAIAVPLLVFGGSFVKSRSENIALAREWAIDGPPCPALTPAEFEARGLKAPRGLTYEGAVFFRQFGHMTCSPLRDRGGRGLRAYAVCQFTSPNALKVVTSRGVWHFAPGPGRPATVATPDGIARCVLNANFRLR